MSRSKLKTIDTARVIRTRKHDLFIVSFVTINGKKSITEKFSRLFGVDHTQITRQKHKNGKLLLLFKNEWMTEGMGLYHEMSMWNETIQFRNCLSVQLKA